MFENELIYLTKITFFEHLEQCFIDDICNFLSKDFLLEETDRISIARWLISFKSHSSCTTNLSCVTESVLCLWRYESLFHALLQLVSECHSVLPCSIENLLPQLNDKYEVHHELSEKSSYKNEFEENMLISELESANNSEILSNMKYEDDDSSLEICENKSVCGTEFSSVLTETDKDKVISEDGKNKLKNESRFEMENLNSVTELKSEQLDLLDNNLHPEEKLVHYFCQLLIPNPELLKNNGIVGWQLKFVLSCHFAVQLAVIPSACTLFVYSMT